MTAPTTRRPVTAALLADVFDLLDKHGYERAPGRTLGAALPRLDSLLADLTATYEGRLEAPGA